jgi:radical SAM/Cys-rich protein
MAQLEKTAIFLEPFSARLARHDFTLARKETATLQINVGFLCNQECNHCHHEAGPSRREVMDGKTLGEVISFARRGHFKVIDITGGAPEMNPHLIDMIRKLSPMAPRIMMRTNLGALGGPQQHPVINVCMEHRVVILASLPSIEPAQTESQRGNGVFQKSMAALQKLNALGYGREGSGLELNLVSNPTGDFFPGPQEEQEKKFRMELQKEWGVVFNQLYSFNNVPLGRFRRWLRQSNREEAYLRALAKNFNPATVEGLMCRTLTSVSWDGYLYDCDFNLAGGLFMGKRKTHISEMDGAPVAGASIAVSNHCYACTAKAGFT